jgi:hypothetical protein
VDSTPDNILNDRLCACNPSFNVVFRVFISTCDPPLDLKLNGLATYLSWSRQIKGALAGRNLEGFLTGEEESRQSNAKWNKWKTTHMLLYTCPLNFIVSSIAVTVDNIQSVKDIWAS